MFMQYLLVPILLLINTSLHAACADINRAFRMATKLVLYYAMSPRLGIPMWAQQAYSTDFAIGQNRPRKVGAWLLALDVY